MRIEIDPGLVERYVMELGAYGAHGATGVWRTVYSPEWIGATRQYAAWCAEAGLSVRHDAVGNVWGVLPGSEPGKSIVSGSHIDTQRPGGRYDGALGALAALVALKALKEQVGPPRRTLEAVALCEEESSRFSKANFWGSSAITGRIQPGTAEALLGYDGEVMAEVMRSVGFDPSRIPEAKRDDIDSFIELHVEQGPILEQAGFPVAIVDAITGIRHYRVTLTGVQNHAGAFPMDLRRDPMAGFAEIASASGRDHGRSDHGRTELSRCRAPPRCLHGRCAASRPERARAALCAARGIDERGGDAPRPRDRVGGNARPQAMSERS
jgi:allantoate deiminase